MEEAKKDSINPSSSPRSSKERMDDLEKLLEAHFRSDFHQKMYAPEKIRLEDFGIHGI